MEPTDYDVSPPQRLATSWQVIKEAGDFDRQEAGALLHAIWTGWSKVIQIQLKSLSDCTDWKQQGKPTD